MTSRHEFHRAARSLTPIGALGALPTSEAFAQPIDQVNIFYGFPARSAGEGSALALSPWSALAIYPHICSKLSYDPIKNFAPVSIAAIIHHGLAVGPLVRECQERQGLSGMGQSEPERRELRLARGGLDAAFHRRVARHQ